MIRFIILTVFLTGLVGCTTAPVKAPQPIALLNATHEVPEDQLLDIGVALFTVATDEDDAQSIPEGVRKAESRFVAVHLKNTLQRSGQWGAVRVMPAGVEFVDVLVKGVIEKSDGEQLALKVEAFDATGVRWLSENYKEHLPANHYPRDVAGEIDPFQNVYNQIANDLVAYRQALAPAALKNVRRVGELRFAADIAPAAFSQHLSRADNGNYRVARLPSPDDPMLKRVNGIRSRDQMLVDTVNSYYDNLYQEMWEPYTSWRKYRADEAATLREVKQKALTRKLLGAAAIAGAIAIGVMGNSQNTGTLENVMVIGGAMAVKSGFDIGAEAEIHEEALVELGESFDAEVAPMVVDVEGQAIELTGSAEAQYSRWRDMLQQIYRKETGLAPATTGGS